MAFRYHSISRKEVGTSLSEINIIPLVDVMLVLLIIFMVTAPMMHSGIGVNLPQAETDSAPADDGLDVTIDKNRYIHIENSVINLFLLEQRLRDIFSGKEKKVVFLKADTDLPYGFVIEIIDIFKKVGVETVGLVVDPKRDKD
ncbi:MAG: biopolymer transporter ExbD [Candidatus Aminicenantes bacterium]|nr:biopolymer transporter ExbD [Candidatus Aminicenantes bacterium]